MSSAKLRLGIYYLRKSVFLIFLNNRLTTYYTITYCLKIKNKKRFFSFQSMPNLNFAELIFLSVWSCTRSLYPRRFGPKDRIKIVADYTVFTSCRPGYLA